MNKVIRYIPEVCLAAVLITAIICNNDTGIVVGAGLWLAFIVVVRLTEEVEKM